MFENDVKIYGIQTTALKKSDHVPFENDVKIYGIQTDDTDDGITYMFENDVKIYGIQTVCIYVIRYSRLRMM